MEAGTATCRKCKSPMQIEPLSGVAGEEGGMKVAFLRLPALVCAQGHRRFVKPDFPGELLERLTAVAQVPAAEARGMVFKSYHCGKCGEKISGAAATHRSFEFDVGVAGIDPFRVALTVPVHVCASCGREQVKSLAEVTEKIPAAMVHAFKAAEIPPG